MEEKLLYCLSSKENARTVEMLSPPKHHLSLQEITEKVSLLVEKEPSYTVGGNVN